LAAQARDRRSINGVRPPCRGGRRAAARSGHRRESSVAAQSRGAACTCSRRWSAAPAARCTAPNGLRAHALSACDVRECSKPLGKSTARQPRPLNRRSSRSYSCRAMPTTMSPMPLHVSRSNDVGAAALVRAVRGRGSQGWHREGRPADRACSESTAEGYPGWGVRATASPLRATILLRCPRGDRRSP
jgi:hypothetical protein